MMCKQEGLGPTHSKLSSDSCQVCSSSWHLVLSVLSIASDLYDLTLDARIDTSGKQ